ncbi:hypothetical protein BG005_007219 [Podila minutissima]|nr:hypothetical protein BG005_007219 [Podila minutissima]
MFAQVLDVEAYMIMDVSLLFKKTKEDKNILTKERSAWLKSILDAQNTFVQLAQMIYTGEIGSNYTGAGEAWVSLHTTFSRMLWEASWNHATVPPATSLLSEIKLAHTPLLTLEGILQLGNDRPVHANNTTAGGSLFYTMDK